MRIKKANLRRLASLLALGTGALGLAAGTAEASSIVYSGVVDERVGWSPGLPGLAKFHFHNGIRAELYLIGTLGCVSGGCSATGVGLSARGRHSTSMRLLGNGLFISAFPLSATFDTPDGKPYGGHRIASRAISTGGRETKFNHTDRYLLFEFTGGDLPHAEYGWAQLNVTITSAGPDATLVDWAYDTSGAEIPAGDTGTPEPSTFALTGLGALALGAKGLRSWRAASKTA
jgi:hypothetical protein